MKNRSEGSGFAVREYLETEVQRRRLFPRAALVGLFSGIVAVAFRLCLAGAEAGRNVIIGPTHGFNWRGFCLLASMGFTGTLLSSLIGRLDRHSGGSGIPHMKAVLEGHATMKWWRLIPVKFAGAVVAIGSGLALGREGPTVQMGGAVGMGVSRLTGASGREKRALIAAGSGAGLAAAFNAPIAGVTFVLEELQRDFQPVVFGATLLAAAVATVISRFAAGALPVFTVPPIATPRLLFTPVFIVIGLLGGVLGVGFNRGLLGLSEALGKLRSSRLLLVSAILGLLAGGVGMVAPELLGGGHGLSELAITGRAALGMGMILLALRFVFVLFSYSSGVPGGIFAPVLSLGATMGLVVYRVVEIFGPVQGLGVAACAVAGMCALFSGVVRAPLTAVILIGEMTGSYDLLLPLLVAAFTAHVVADGLKDVPIYDALLERDAAKNNWDLADGESAALVLEVSPGAPLVGLRLRDAELPSGVLVVVCRLAGKEFVPDGDTTIVEHMRLLVTANSEEDLRDVRTRASAPKS